MLSLCKAVVIGRTPGQIEFMAKTADRCGFGYVEGAGRPGGEQFRNALQFVLIDYRVGDGILRSILTAVRGGEDDARFSPIVVIADDCPWDRVLFYVRLGVDDVISLPEKREFIAQRLTQQLGHEQMYIETQDYFGPDRRRMEIGVANSRRQGIAAHARYFFRRVPGRGIEILRHEIFSGKVDQPLRKVG